MVSNFLKYKDGQLDGYDTSNMIHVFNKNESALKGSKEFDLLHDRNNIIVMGDSLGDAGMGDGCVSGADAHILKIGFLNEHVSKIGVFDLLTPTMLITTFKSIRGIRTIKNRLTFSD